MITSGLRVEPPTPPALHLRLSIAIRPSSYPSSPERFKIGDRSKLRVKSCKLNVIIDLEHAAVCAVGSAFQEDGKNTCCVYMLPNASRIVPFRRYSCSTKHDVALVVHRWNMRAVLYENQYWFRSWLEGQDQREAVEGIPSRVKESFGHLFLNWLVLCVFL